ncbi:MAG: hypothetical protein COW84_06375 [Gammaproteobacteria bacterium CG22_combo_CG10-13_8_21_14_all_40_8]|nr:MAG: hypothetical protein COW84_06375 [Gammaproteobacteria bacterium CG22_combo_CG10-13_8_21_14_all_40_8]
MLAILSIIPYVSWAIYVNYSYGLSTVIQVTITQSALSFFMTIFLTQIIIYFYHFQHSLPVKIILAVLGSSIFSNIVVYSTHYLAGTPAILMTMLPGAVFGLLYSIIYSFRLAGKLAHFLNRLKS